MQGVVKIYDPATKSGSLLVEPDLQEVQLASGAVTESSFRFLRQGQRVVFDLDPHGHAENLRLGSEHDMATSTQAPPTRS